MKPAKKFVLGAVYATKGEISNSWSPAICVKAGTEEDAELCYVNRLHPFLIDGGSDINTWFRIRPRDWEGGKWGSLGEPEPVNPWAKQEAEFFAAKQRKIDAAILADAAAESLSWYHTSAPRIFDLDAWHPGNACTCGIGDAPARQHWDSCPRKTQG